MYDLIWLSLVNLNSLPNRGINFLVALCTSFTSLPCHELSKPFLQWFSGHKLWKKLAHSIYRL